MKFTSKIEIEFYLFLRFIRPIILHMRIIRSEGFFHFCPKNLSCKLLKQRRICTTQFLYGEVRIGRNLMYFLTARITDETRSFICRSRCQRVKITPEWRRNDDEGDGCFAAARNQDQGPSIACVRCDTHVQLQLIVVGSAVANWNGKSDRILRTRNTRIADVYLMQSAIPDL